MSIAQRIEELQSYDDGAHGEMPLNMDERCELLALQFIASLMSN